VDPLDQQVFAGAKSPGEFNFGVPPAGVEVSVEQEVAMRELFVEHGIPASVGSFIGKLYNAALANPPTQEQMDRAYEDSHAQLSKMWGADTAKNLALANRFLDQVAKSRPEVKQMLKVSGLANNALVVSNVYSIAKARGLA